MERPHRVCFVQINLNRRLVCAQVLAAAFELLLTLLSLLPRVRQLPWGAYHESLRLRVHAEPLPPRLDGPGWPRTPRATQTFHRIEKWDAHNLATTASASLPLAVGERWAVRRPRRMREAIVRPKMLRQEPC